VRFQRSSSFACSRVASCRAVDTEHRSDARNQRSLVHGLGEVLVGSGIASDHVMGIAQGGHQDHWDELQRDVRLEAPADLEAVHRGHHMGCVNSA